MGPGDKLKELTAKAKQAAAEHKDDLHKAANQVEALADKRTQGKYRGQIRKAAAKVESLIDKIPEQPGDAPAEGGAPSGPEPG